METNMVIVPFLFAFTCFIVPAIIWGAFLWSSVLRSSRAVGRIINYESGSTDGDVAAPIIEFQVPDGRKFTFKGAFSNETMLDALYEAFLKYVLKRDAALVRVLYDPNDPQKARVNSIGNIYLMPIILFLFGACILLYAIPATRGIFTQVIDIIDRLSNIF